MERWPFTDNCERRSYDCGRESSLECPHKTIQWKTSSRRPPTHPLILQKYQRLRSWELPGLVISCCGPFHHHTDNSSLQHLSACHRLPHQEATHTSQLSHWLPGAQVSWLSSCLYPWASHIPSHTLGNVANSYATSGCLLASQATWPPTYISVCCSDQVPGHHQCPVVQ